VASDSNGNLDYINRYDSYGVPSASNQGRFGYTGQQYLPELCNKIIVMIDNCNQG
jgi:hypothetical protein